MSRWRAQRLGLFIHWGPVSRTGQEISWSRGTSIPSADYDTLYRGFDPTGFSARAWVDLAKAAGMRYLTLTFKHHDGFCLWDTRYSPYNVMATPFARDPAGELAEECRRQGLGFQAYYSVADRYQPDYLPAGPGGPGFALPAGQTPSMDRYQGYLAAQASEILDRYRPDAFWFDGDWDATWGGERGAAVYRTLKTARPTLVINDRLQGARGLGDFRTWERAIGAFDAGSPWETTATLAEQWSYQPGGSVRAVKDVLQEMLAVIGGDGNYLLDVGPGPDGKIRPEEAARLMELGRWVNAHGEGIHGTRGGPYYPGAWGASTQSGNRVFLHILAWPPDGRFRFPGLPRRVLSARRISGGSVEVTQGPDSLAIELPSTGCDSLAETIALELDGPVSGPLATAVNGLGLPGTWLSRTAGLRASSMYGAPVDSAGILGAEIYARDFSMHTALEDSPSIVLDLGRLMTVASVDIANRSAHATVNSQVQDFQARARTLTIWLSRDGLAWEEAWRADGARPYWSAAIPAQKGTGLGRTARFVKVGLRERNWLHLANVKVFGNPEPDRPYAAALRAMAAKPATNRTGYPASYRADGRNLPRGKIPVADPMVKKYHPR